MLTNITIIDEEYKQWVTELAAKYQRAQIKASVKVNQELLGFYWNLGHDIVQRHAENKYGSKFYAAISHDLTSLLPNRGGLSERNIRYCKEVYLLYSQSAEILPQVVAELDSPTAICGKLSCVPWGHHRLIIDRCRNDVNKAWFFVNKVVEEGWSRSVLLNFIWNLAQVSPILGEN